MSLPPNAVPPSSTARTVTVAVPLAFGRGRVAQGPVRRTCGWAPNRAGLSLPTLNVTAWPVSLGGPGEMPVAQPDDRLAPGVLEHGLVGPGGEDRGAVDRGHRDRERLGGARVAAADGGAAVVDGLHRHGRDAARARRRV